MSASTAYLLGLLGFWAGFIVAVVAACVYAGRSECACCEWCECEENEPC